MKWPIAEGLTIPRDKPTTTTNRLTLERLVELMSTQPDKQASDVLQQWKDEYDNGVKAQQLRAQQEAKDNPTRYGLMKMIDATQVAGGQYIHVRVPSEHIAIASGDLSDFALTHHMKMSDLWLLLNGDIAELQNYRVWTSPRWSASKDYRNRSDDIRDREALLAEDQRDRAAAAARAELAKQQAPLQKDYPNYTTYTPRKEATNV